MNTFLETQIRNMKFTLQTFQESCRMATLADDGKTSKKEEKQLKRIEQACKNFEKELNRVMK